VKKVFIPLVIILVLAFIITGCGNNTTTAPSSTAPGSTTPVATQPSGTTPSGSTPAGSTPATTTPAAGAQKYGGILTWISEGVGPTAPIGWIPENWGPNGVTPIICFETPLKEMLDKSLRPGLAASWDINNSADSPSVTFHLQKGVKFSDGTDFNAAAMKWNLDNLKKEPRYGSSTAKWKSIDVIDDYTIRVNFSSWDNSLVRFFGDSPLYMASPTAFEKNGIDWVRYNMVGTGPFLQKDFQREVTLSGTRNPNYWQAGKPYLDGVTYLFVSDALTATALFKSGGGDVLQTNNPPVLRDLATTGNIIISVALGPFSLFPDSANDDSPWSNPLVRQAAEYAIDKEAMAAAFGYGFKSAYQFSTKDSLAYDPSIQGRHYDPAKAKALLAQAGYPDGFKTTIIGSPLFLNQDAVVSLQSYFAKVGIKADMQFPGFAQFTDINSNPTHNAVIWSSINEWNNQNTTFQYFLAPANPVQFISTKPPDGYAELLDASKAAPEQDPTMLKQIENMIYNEDSVIPMYYNANNFVFKPYVMDTSEGLRGQSNWWEPADTWLDK
jgi:peptide/nickel transport system substrate-binding protein